MMSSLPNLPEWFIRLLIYMIYVGVLSALAAIVWVIVWLIQHVRFI